MYSLFWRYLLWDRNSDNILFCSKKPVVVLHPSHKPWKTKLVLDQIQPQRSLFFHLPVLLEKGDLKSLWFFNKVLGGRYLNGFPKECLCGEMIKFS